MIKTYGPSETGIVGYEPPSTNLTGIAVGSAVGGALLLALAIGAVVCNNTAIKNYNKGFNDALHATSKNTSNVNINS